MGVANLVRRLITIEADRVETRAKEPRTIQRHGSVRMCVCACVGASVCACVRECVRACLRGVGACVCHVPIP